MLINSDDKSIKEEGERMVPAFHKGALVYGEHITRYESIVHLLQGKTVLDIASGSGYGSYIISGAAKKVYGVDIDQESVEYAQRNYGKNNIDYRQGSAEKIPLEDNSVDIVVSFETIEHVKNYKKFLSEVKRVLKKDGLAIISTPNDPEFPEGNHFHLHEFEEKELGITLKGYFKNTTFSYQYTWLMAGVLKSKTANSESTSQMPVDNLAPVPSTKAIYFMVLCSDAKLDGLEVKELLAISEHWSARDQQVRAKQVSDRQKQLESERDALLKNLAVKEKNFITTENKLKAIHNSKGWRLLSSVYALKIKISQIFHRK